MSNFVPELADVRRELAAIAACVTSGVHNLNQTLSPTSLQMCEIEGYCTVLSS